MFINKNKNGKNNLCGEIVAKRRKELEWSQRELADRLQLIGLDIDKNAIQRIEAGLRFVTDIEIAYLAEVLGLSILQLIPSFLKDNYTK